jgi:hypothetical protein
MSFQNTEAFPALAAPTAKPQAKQGGTPFVWAKLVNGEKKDLAAVEADAKAKKEAAEKARFEKEEKRLEAVKEQLLREKLIREGRETEFNKANAHRIAVEKACQKESDEKYCRENGWWRTGVTYRKPAGDSFYVPFPKSTVNEKSLQFVQLWLTEFPELAKITTIGELQTAFYDAVVPWLDTTSPRSASNVAGWEEEKYPGQKSTNAELHGELQALLAQGKTAEATAITQAIHHLNATRYRHFQEWVWKEEKEYNESTYKIARCSPWALYDIWIKAKHITWENVLFAMSKLSGAFPHGLIEIQGHFSKPASRIKWVVSLEPYLSTRFSSKPTSGAKRQRLDDDDWLMSDCN